MLAICNQHFLNLGSDSDDITTGRRRGIVSIYQRFGFQLRLVLKPPFLDLSCLIMY
jgi:hypothetical protein